MTLLLSYIKYNIEHFFYHRDYSYYFFSWSSSSSVSISKSRTLFVFVKDVLLQYSLEEVEYQILVKGDRISANEEFFSF